RRKTSRNRRDRAIEETSRTRPVLLETNGADEVAVLIVDIHRPRLNRSALRLGMIRHRCELPVQPRNISRDPVKTRIQAHVIFSDLRICNVEVFFSGWWTM